MYLFMMPTFSAPSELWMRRMLAGLEGRLAAIACYEAPVTRAFGTQVIDLGARSDAASIAAGERRLGEMLDSGRVGAVLAHYLPFALRHEAVFDRHPAVPIYVHVHGYDITFDLRRPDPVTGELRRFHPAGYLDDVRRLSRRAVLLANSHQSVAKLTAAGVPESRIRLKYLGVPVGPYRPPPPRESGRLDCLYLGRLVDFKGPLETLAAFGLAAAGGMAGHLTFAGDGPLRDALAAAVADSTVRDRVRLPGAVSAEQGAELRASHHVFVSHSQLGPSTGQEEALGVSYLEALADGLPIVSASGGSLGEVVREGVTGLLVPPGDVAGQASALLRLSRDDALYRRLSSAAHIDAGERFSDDAERDFLIGLLTSNRGDVR
jgi:colanic acid/amylovoran biosynthesis glycosyltransferase